jgi:tRNA pseudouridine55 synthase
MYKLARAGKDVERKPRPITIYELELVDWTPPNLQIRVVCSTGTYIRSLAHDIGEMLSCGGHITVLRRTAVGEFKSSDAISLEALAAQVSQDVFFATDQAVINLPRIDANEAETEALLMGQFIPCLSDDPEETLARVYSPTGEFFGILLRQGDVWRPKKMFPPES